MIVSSTQQIINFLIAALVGAALGVVYDFFKVLRLIGLNGKIASFFEDILFFLIATLTLFSYYMQFTEGRFRIYAFIGSVLGFVVYFLTLEKLVFFVIKKVYFILCKAFNFVYKKLVFPAFRKSVLFLKKLIFNPIKFLLEKIKQNICIFLKNLLPKKRKMLYNSRKVSKKRKGKLRHAESRDKESAKAFFC